MLKDLFWRLPAAFFAPAYWAAAAWLCFAAVGQDPLDAFSPSGTTGARLFTLVLMAAAIVVFALTARWWFVRNVGRSGAHVQ